MPCAAVPWIQKRHSHPYTGMLAAQYLLLGHQIGGLGATCGLALIIRGRYLIARGFGRWEIPLAFIAALCVISGGSLAFFRT